MKNFLINYIIAVCKKVGHCHLPPLFDHSTDPAESALLSHRNLKRYSEQQKGSNVGHV
jgi:hypothetical protein